MSRGSWRIPLASARSQLEADITRAAADLKRAVASGRATSPVLIGRTPHVLSVLSSAAGLPNQLPLMIDETVLNKIFFGKHADEMVGVTPEMLVRAMYRPAAVVADRAQAGSVTLVTNILTPFGPVVVSVNTQADWRGERVAMVASAYPRGKGEVADWIRGAPGRDVIYVDEPQIGEAVTGNLNPENADATRKGWRLVSARGEINGLGHDAGGPPSPRSDNAIVSNWAAPVNANYRGLATIKDALQKLLTGKGVPKAKTYADLLRWIDKHYSGDAGDKPLFSRASAPPAAIPAPAVRTAAERAEAIIQNAASTPAPLDAFARTLTRITGLERLTTLTYGLGARLLDTLTPERVKAGLVSDYGIPDAVVDHRARMQGTMLEQLRQSGKLLEKLATLTRAESRVAYEWMNGEDTRAADELMKDLPEESVAVLRQVRTMIDDLSKEAVRLGQLDPEAFKRHRFAYLRRSYFKHTATMSQVGLTLSADLARYRRSPQR